jgi:hypothetical protein
MKWINFASLILLVLGGLNLGAMALIGHGGEFMANLFGGDGAIGARLVYGLVGLSALWQLMPLFQAWKIGEADAEANRHSHA